MKSINCNTVDYVKIASYLAGEMSHDQKASFLNEIENDPLKKRAFDESAKLWNTAAANSEYIEIDTSQAWELLVARMPTGYPLVQKQSKRKEYWITTPMRWAAAILIIISAATFLLLNGRQSHQAEMISIVNNEAATRVKTLSDGSVVYLAHGASLSIPLQFDDNSRTLELSGKGYFEVADDYQRPFTVQTKQASITALGTSFNVNTLSDGTLEVFVNTGRVIVIPTDQDAGKLEVGRGELLTLSGRNMNKTFPIHAYNIAWRKNQMHFKDEYLPNMIKVLNQNYNSRFVIADSELYSRRLTVTFYNNSIPTITQLICLSLNLDHEIKPDSSIVLRQKQ